MAQRIATPNSDCSVYYCKSPANHHANGSDCFVYYRKCSAIYDASGSDCPIYSCKCSVSNVFSGPDCIDYGFSLIARSVYGPSGPDRRRSNLSVLPKWCSMFISLLVMDQLDQRRRVHNLNCAQSTSARVFKHQRFLDRSFLSFAAAPQKLPCPYNHAQALAIAEVKTQHLSGPRHPHRPS